MTAPTKTEPLVVKVFAGDKEIASVTDSRIACAVLNQIYAPIALAKPVRKEGA